ncbi:saccharopine dehydrogenase-like oxidoreductase [Scaptodrosophila lebanonensis]|uniref:Saccharopine dehydrogenase-like oxidoreductase n=1 Tax=Drosophila lebanonensis TaxID=7225 RepID=A0A6J2TFR3_DROLE|nr:saccharopine dehydrogenase-like oxidoreductase [Scaptodrosophila lebanonensis]
MCSEQCIEKDAAEKFVFSVTFKATGCTLPRVSINRDGESLVVSGPSPRCSSPTTGKTTVEQFEKTLKVKICGMNPFFGVGCVALLSSAITVLKQTDDLPGKGGVFTPGAAFRNTHILQEVTKHNPRFKYKIL